ncbi:copper homeostasis protein CutC [Erysipelothrix sp. HDW6B]|uniref:copper homeostasis protein CutC n=1 Tax=Erysipelothrix sp. HDW6B TaxID=2714929 RepID=UPI00140CD725|nr:copper homeostasis protein CutC [Erysipelothrix sp. HDW6B]QIK86302.1 copper homeostasis protein CutC [Erysipelothrix sp. HDW6B]
MTYCVEVLAASPSDCEIAEQCGADRIELNNGIHLGGLTPSIGTLVMARRVTKLPIVAMVRPRPGGFHYNPMEVETMFVDAKQLIAAGADGLVFGFLNADRSVDASLTQSFVELCHEHGIEAIFHRAFDCVEDPFAAIEVLIECGVDRILTSGLKDTAIEGVALLKTLQAQYGNRIELCLGSGINAANALTLINQTGVKQLHGSFKGWNEDPTTRTENVSYAFSDLGDYDGVDPEKLKEMIDVINTKKAVSM